MTSATRPRKPAAVWLAVLTFALMAVFWVVAAAYLWVTEDTHTLLSAGNVVRAFMLANALILLILAGGLWARRRLFWWLALGYMGANIVLTITDQVGLVDVLYLLVCVALGAMLVVTRRWFSM